MRNKKSLIVRAIGTNLFWDLHFNAETRETLWRREDKYLKCQFLNHVRYIFQSDKGSEILTTPRSNRFSRYKRGYSHPRPYQDKK